jgi:hypothetical protein
MRIIYGLFAVSVALFISGIGFVIAAARSGGDSDSETAAPATMPVATTLQIMRGITGPNARIVYDSVGIIMNTEGVKEIAPQDDEEWAAVANAAAAVIESGNLLLIGNRVLDNGDWVTMTRAMMETGQAALKAAQDQDKDAILEAGSPLNDTCDACHAKYQRQ